MDVISLQSCVTSGYVGNAAAIPTLEATGVTPWAVDSVRYAHHPGHGPVTPEVPATSALSRSLAEAISHCTPPACLLSGYLVNAEQGRMLLAQLREARHDNRLDAYYLDPVFGDDAEGTYVDPALISFFRDEALPESTVLLPNRYELVSLSGMPVDNIDEAVKAARSLIERGPELVFVSSIPAPDRQACRALANVLVNGREAWSVTVKNLPLHAKGTGDMLSAAFCGLHAQGLSPSLAMTKAVSIVDAAATDAANQGTIELDLPKILKSFALSAKVSPPASPHRIA
ncbi:pyridoxal kinase [Thalassospiraceae bacterium LMO-JJ14]|nr:pyridoxal kinase [Thalassospiraceae bacterium LMO-JJ14]